MNDPYHYFNQNIVQTYLKTKGEVSYGISRI